MIAVDTSIIAYLWGYRTTGEARCALLERNGRWFAPVLWRSEFRNILAGYLRRGQLGIDDARHAYDGAARLLRGNERMPTTESVLALVAMSDLSAYDCEFIAVANALQIQLATYDRKILKTFPQTARSLEQLLR